jgi:hypothetical protein
MAVVIENIRLPAAFHLDTPTERFHQGKLGKEPLDTSQGEPEQKFETAEIPLLPQLDGPLVWTGDDFKSASDYTYTLTNDEVNEIENALEHFKALGLRGNEVAPTTFPLPILGSKLKSLCHELFSGRGFFNIRGLEPKKYTPEDNVLIFLAVSSYLANRVGKQDDEGFMLGHIRDSTESSIKPTMRPFRDSTLQLTFHTDSFTDLLAMQTRGLAARGGGQVFTSSWKVYNELLKERPDVLRTLVEPNWYFENRGTLEDGKPRSVIFLQDGKVVINFVRYMLLGRAGLARSPDLPACTPAQVEALDVLETVARKHQLLICTQPGDLTYFNNLALIHSREAFENDETHIRHMVRLWLRNEELAWKTPLALQRGFDKVFYDVAVEEQWNIAPQPRLSFKVHQTLGP